MTTNADAASKPPVAAGTVGDPQGVIQRRSPVASDGAVTGARASGEALEPDAAMAADRVALATSPCRANHMPALTALLREHAVKGAPDAMDVLGFKQHKSKDGPSLWHDVPNIHLHAGRMEAQAR